MFTYSAPKRIMIRGNKTENFYSRRYDTETRKQAWLSTGRTSLRAAMEEVKSWELEDAQGKRAIEAKAIGPAIDEWLAKKGTELSPLGLEGYTAYAGQWKEHFGQGALLRSLGHGDLERYFALRAESLRRGGPPPRPGKPRKAAGGVGPGTLNRERNAIRQFLRWCGLREWIEGDPAATIRRYQEPKRAIRALSHEEEEKLLRACARPYEVVAIGKRNAGGREGGESTEEASTWEQGAPRPPRWLHSLVTLLLRTGLRLGTLQKLEWSDVDLETRTLRIPAKKMKAREGLEIPIDSETAALLAKLKAQASSLAVLEGLPHRTVIRQTFLRAAERAGLGHVRVHDLRATFVSKARRAGIPLEVTARLAGHADARTTLRFYRGLEETELRAAIDKLGAETLAGRKGRGSKRKAPRA